MDILQECFKLASVHLRNKYSPKAKKNCFALINLIYTGFSNKVIYDAITACRSCLLTLLVRHLKSLAYVRGGDKWGSTGSWFYVNHELQKNRSRFPLHASPLLTASLAVRLTSSPTMPLGQKRWIRCPSLPGLLQTRTLKIMTRKYGKIRQKKEHPFNNGDNCRKVS